MLRLVEADSTAAGQADLGDGSPTLFLNIRTRHAFFFERGHLGLEIVTHEIKFVPIIFFGGMECGLRGRQSKNQPSVPGINRSESENVAKEGTISLGIFCCTR
jgi:hypothetical protein